MIKRYAAGPQLNFLRALLAACCPLLPALLFPSLTAADSTHTAGRSISLQVSVGFNENYRLNLWAPVQIALSNSGADFSGTISVYTFSSQARSSSGPVAYSPWNFQVPVKLARGARKAIHLNIPLYYVSTNYPFGVEARVLDTQGHVVVARQDVANYLNPNDILVGVFSANNAGFGPLSTVALPYHASSIVVTSLDAASMPASSDLLTNFDMLIFDDFTTATLSAAQRAALISWVNQGGALIEVGGTGWQRTLRGLPSELVPVSLLGTGLLPPGTHLLPEEVRMQESDSGNGNLALDDTLQQSIPISRATLSAKGTGGQSQGDKQATTTVAPTSLVVLSSGTVPLQVETQHGQGTICYLAFDPAVQPFLGWPAISVFWKGLLLRALGDRTLIGNAPKFSSGPGDVLVKEGVEQILQPPYFFSPWIAAVLLLSYILILGPLSILLLRRLKRPQWIWRIILAGIVFFSLFSYGLSFYAHGAALLDNTISLVQLNAGGSPAHITTYSGIFTPDDGDFTIQFPANELVLPISYPLSASSPVYSSGDPHISLSPTPESVIVREPGTGTWTFHALVSQQDVQLQGKITADLTLKQSRLVGSITNTLDAALNDVFVLVPHGFVSIGHLPAGETTQVDLPLRHATKAEITLADAIALNNGLPASYFPYSDNGQATNDFQRHVATLEALSGVGIAYTPCGGPCITQALVSKGAVLTAPPGTPETLHVPVNSDPLLLNGAQATLIGWADAPLDGANAVMINHKRPNGFHDNLVEAPLALDFQQNASVPPNIVQGRVVDEQNSDVELTAPGTYSLTIGTVSFEFALPLAQGAAMSTMTVTEPNAIYDLTHQTHPRAAGDVIQASLFNWQTNGWERITLNSGTFTTTQAAAYIGPGGRVLLQVANADPSGLLLFAKPSVSVQ
jgi:hypothetical protein